MGRSLTAEQIKEIPTLLEKQSITGVARILEVTPGTIRGYIKLLRAEGYSVPIKKPGRPKLTLNDQI